MKYKYCIQVSPFEEGDVIILNIENIQIPVTVVEKGSDADQVDYGSGVGWQEIPYLQKVDAGDVDLTKSLNNMILDKSLYVFSEVNCE